MLYKKLKFCSIKELNNKIDKEKCRENFIIILMKLKYNKTVILFKINMIFFDEYYKLFLNIFYYFIHIIIIQYLYS